VGPNGCGRTPGRKSPDERPPAWPKHAADFDQASDPLDERAEQKPAQGIVDASVAGVGRVTLYGHFPSRQKLLDAVFAHALAKADTALDAEVIDHGAASEALSRLIRSSWPILAQHRGLLAGAQRDLPPARIGQHHDQTMARVERLIARGQDEGDLRTDLPRPWLVATFYSLMLAAAEEVNAGRLDPAQAGGVLVTTILAALTA